MEAVLSHLERIWGSCVPGWWRGSLRYMLDGTCKDLK